MTAASHTEVRIMTISHADFIRSFQPLNKFYQYHVDESQRCIHINDGPRNVEINLGPERPHHLGALQLPTTQVTLTFTGFTKQELELFWHRFDLCFRRGGG